MDPATAQRGAAEAAKAGAEATKEMKPKASFVGCIRLRVQEFRVKGFRG